MSAKAREPEAATPRPGLMAAMNRALWGEYRNMSWLLLVTASFVGAILVLWKYVGPDVVEKPEYQVQLKDLEVTPAPGWISSDVAADVYRGLERGELLLLDDDLCDRLSKAFAAHPWVAKVERVSKRHPAHVTVDLVYRRPVCVVEKHPEPGFAIRAHAVDDRMQQMWPVDVTGVLLPKADFTAEKCLQYPLLLFDAIDPPEVPVGRQWKDARVRGGAEVAAALGEVWGPLQLSHISPSSHVHFGTFEGEMTYEVFMRGRSRILWGRPPSTHTPDEVPVFDKIARLKRHAAQHGGLLDGPNGPQEIDVRDWKELHVIPLTADHGAFQSWRRE